MKETITVKIIEGGKASEVNPFGENGSINIFITYAMLNEAESKLREFQIEKWSIGNETYPDVLLIENTIGLIFKAKILDNGKIEIL